MTPKQGVQFLRDMELVRALNTLIINSDRLRSVQHGDLVTDKNRLLRLYNN